MIEFKGKYASAVVMIDAIDGETEKQIKGFLDHPAFAHSYIAIMPDCHAGAGAVIGFTMKLNDYVIPNIVGVDIGCGVLAVKLAAKTIDFKSLDEFIKANIPAGFAHRQQPYHISQNFAEDVAYVSRTIGEDYQKVICQLGTLGGGNHFIEVDYREDTGEYWLVIHTGSRNFGLKVANFYQKQAQELLKAFLINAEAFKGLEYLPIKKGGEQYLSDMRVAQTFAKTNRQIIAEIITGGFFREDVYEVVESIHNYISPDDNIIRKGAISAYENERVIIPFNMRDGVAIGTGKSNRRWNFSAPHGAGRIMSRSQAKKTLDAEAFVKSMADAGIYTTTAVKDTLDEAPEAYKGKELIIEAIRPTVDIEFLMKPVYNFKAAE